MHDTLEFRLRRLQRTITVLLGRMGILKVAKKTVELLNAKLK